MSDDRSSRFSHRSQTRDFIFTVSEPGNPKQGMVPGRLSRLRENQAHLEKARLQQVHVGKIVQYHRLTATVSAKFIFLFTVLEHARAGRPVDATPFHYEAAKWDGRYLPVRKGDLVHNAPGKFMICHPHLSQQEAERFLGLNRQSPAQFEFHQLSMEVAHACHYLCDQIITEVEKRKSKA